MKINWKDLLIAFLIGTAIDLLFAVTITSTSLIFNMLSFVMVTFISLGFYFWRNRNAWVDAAVISFIYGFVFIFFTQPFFILLAALFGGWDALAAYKFDLAAATISGFVVGVMAIITGCIAEYALICLDRAAPDRKG
jgi:hypothetical protein